MYGRSVTFQVPGSLRGLPGLAQDVSLLWRRLPKLRLSNRRSLRMDSFCSAH